MKERKKTIRKFTGIILMIFSLYSLVIGIYGGSAGLELVCRIALMVAGAVLLLLGTILYKA